MVKNLISENDSFNLHEVFSETNSLNMYSTVYFEHVQHGVFWGRVGKTWCVYSCCYKNKLFRKSSKIPEIQSRTFGLESECYFYNLYA